MTVPSLKPDESWGMGGEYLLDPKTGKRTLIARTQPPTTEQSDASVQPQAVDPDQDGSDVRN